VILGHGRNTLNAACFPQGAEVLRLHDGGCRLALLFPKRDVYNWTRLDQHLAASEAKGVPSLYVFCSTPAWAAQVPDSPPASVWGDNPTGNCPPNPQDWGTIVDALIAHVRRPDGSLRIKFWEMWNETNSLGFYCGTNAQLLVLAQILYQKVKAADPTAMVTTPTPCWDKTNVVQAMDTYLGMGFGKYADIVSFHGYVSDGAPAASIGSTLDGLKALLTKYQVKLPLWDTEYGFKSPALVPDSQKAQWVRDSIAIRAQKGIAAAFWYQWDNQTHGTMVSSTGVLTPAGKGWVDSYATLRAPRLPAVLSITQVR
jgi:hypothetical protein